MYTYNPRKISKHEIHLRKCTFMKNYHLLRFPPANTRFFSSFKLKVRNFLAIDPLIFDQMLEDQGFISEKDSIDSEHVLLNHFNTAQALASALESCTFFAIKKTKVDLKPIIIFLDIFMTLFYAPNLMKVYLEKALVDGMIQMHLAISRLYEAEIRAHLERAGSRTSFVDGSKSKSSIAFILDPFFRLNVRN